MLRDLSRVGGPNPVGSMQVFIGNSVAPYNCFEQTLPPQQQWHNNLEELLEVVHVDSNLSKGG